MRLRSKITLTMFALTLVVSGLLTVFIYRFIDRQMHDEVRERLRDVAHLGSHAVDLATYERLYEKLGELDPASVAHVEQSADYRAISNQLQTIRATDPELVKYVYLLAPTDDPMSPRFVVDADVLALETRGSDAERVSHFGQHYDASHIPKLVAALRDCRAKHEADFVYDDEFHVESVSAYVPLPESATTHGRCIGVLGVDVTVHEVDAALAATTRLEIAVSIAGIVLALGASFLVGSLLTRSVLALTAVVKRFGAKDFAARAGAVSNDELGELGARLDAMAEVVERHSAHLERVAEDRGIQLAEAQAEVRVVRAAGEGRYTGRALGAFTLGSVIGRGAMGEVYEATDRDGRAVAVKVLASQLLGDVAALARFHREARAIAALDTPHVVKLVDVSPHDAALPFFVMERLRGADLNQLLKERPTRELADVVEIVTAIAGGLDAAHAAGVVHRDLKPANVFSARDGDAVTWKILDFGVSKFTGEATVTADQIVGTPSYMAPEQARGDKVDMRCDIYALGAIAYRLLVGRPPVVPKDAPAMLIDVVFKMPPQPSALVAVPSQVEAVLAVALAKQPGDRFATAGELAIELAAAARGAADAVLARAAAVLARAPWGGWIDGAPGASTDPPMSGGPTVPGKKAS